MFHEVCVDVAVVVNLVCIDIDANVNVLLMISITHSETEIGLLYRFTHYIGLLLFEPTTAAVAAVSISSASLFGSIARCSFGGVWMQHRVLLDQSLEYFCTEVVAVLELLHV